MSIYITGRKKFIIIKLKKKKKKQCFLGVIDNLKTKHINVLAIQLPCQKLFFSYLGYKNFGYLAL